MRSQLYECRVMHQRFSPKRHRFAYRIFMVGLDLDELAAVHRASWLFSVNRANLYALRECDYLPLDRPRHNPSSAAGRGPLGDRTLPEPAGAAGAASCGGLKARVAALLRVHGIELGDGRVELITLPRVLGYQFNPVSFYVARTVDGRPLAALAEVTNTFRETKPFFLGAPAAEDGAFHVRVPKHFYVSPYSDVDVEFDFTLRPHAGRVSIQIDDYAAGRRTLTSTLVGPGRPWRDRTLAWFALKYPLLTLQVIGLIHWHALLLHLKGVPWFRKAARAAEQRDLFRPHASLTSARPFDA